ncbi:MAG: hypothetical protein ACYC6Z_03945 [Thermoleophilia bacterium]
MGVFWSLMLLISLALLIAGMIKPSLFSALFRTDFTRKKSGLIFGAIFVAVIILGTIFPAKK